MSYAIPSRQLDRSWSCFPIYIYVSLIYLTNIYVSLRNKFKSKLIYNFFDLLRSLFLFLSTKSYKLSSWN